VALEQAPQQQPLQQQQQPTQQQHTQQEQAEARQQQAALLTPTHGPPNAPDSADTDTEDAEQGAEIGGVEGDGGGGVGFRSAEQGCKGTEQGPGGDGAGSGVGVDGAGAGDTDGAHTRVQIEDQGGAPPDLFAFLGAQDAGAAEMQGSEDVGQQQQQQQQQEEAQLTPNRGRYVEGRRQRSGRCMCFA